MKWINRLERKYRRYAIPDLMKYIVFITLAVYILDNFLLNQGQSLISYLVLDPTLVLHGEVWRLLTFIFIPPNSSMIFIAFVLYFYYMIGTSLETEWGTFRFNLYYLLGIMGAILSSFITSSPVTSVYLNLSLFLAFARLNPSYQIYIFFILPIRMKYLAWLYWAIIIYTILFAPVGSKVAAVLSFINYYAFFGREMVHQTKMNRKVAANKRSFRLKLPNEYETMHRCTICGITEGENPEMEFRYCSKCEVELEYCMNHLQKHEHVKQKQN